MDGTGIEILDKEITVSDAAEKPARAALAASGTTRRTGGRPRRSDEHDRGIAMIYLERFSDPQSRKRLVKNMASEFDVKPDKMRDWVSRARQLGFLSKGHRGKAGATAGPRLT